MDAKRIMHKMSLDVQFAQHAVGVLTDMVSKDTISHDAMRHKGPPPSPPPPYTHTGLDIMPWPALSQYHGTGSLPHGTRQDNNSPDVSVHAAAWEEVPPSGRMVRDPRRSQHKWREQVGPTLGLLPVRSGAQAETAAMAQLNRAWGLPDILGIARWYKEQQDNMPSLG